MIDIKKGISVAVFAAVIMFVAFIAEKTGFDFAESRTSGNKPANTVSYNKEVFQAELKKGDYLYFGEYMNEPILWQVLDIQSEEPLLMTEYVICFKSFDACGEDNFYHNGEDRQKFGSSEWEHSTLRDWLNSSETVVTYSHCPPNEQSVYLGENAYSKEKGFLNEENFSSHIKNLISDDGVFVLGTSDLKKYFKNKSCAKKCTDKAAKYNSSPYLIMPGGKVWYWTSSAISSNRVSVAAVTSSGGFYKALAYDSAMGVSPAMKLKNNFVLAVSGNGTFNQPYMVV